MAWKKWKELAKAWNAPAHARSLLGILIALKLLKSLNLHAGIVNLETYGEKKPMINWKYPEDTSLFNLSYQEKFLNVWIESTFGPPWLLYACNTLLKNYGSTSLCINHGPGGAASFFFYL